VELLNQELNATKEYLQSIIEEQEATNEELRAANEEILSSNEELQSTNEEMETAKEELQSANEELTTVNEELQNRNAELNLVNNDVNNLLASVHIPIVMLGIDLRIRRFTPAAEKLLNLIPTDLGRPVSDINMNIATPDLAELIADVIDSVQTRDIEVQDKNGHWYNLQMRPYKTMDNKIDGAVLTLIDIDSMKRSVGKLQEYQMLCAGVVEALDQPLVLLSDSMKVRLANDAFFRTFKLPKGETENRNFFELANGQWNVPDFRRLMEQIVPKRSRLKNYLLETNSRGAAKRKLLVNARHLPMDGQKETFIVMSLDEIPKIPDNKKNSKSK
jgi:two-component system CheB/CheR fusion protein